MKNRTSAASRLARAAIVALLAFSAAFVAGCGKDKGEKELKAGIEAFKAKNFDEAQKLFEAAADKNNDEAVFLLGSIYLVKDDEAKAFDFFRKAAKAGNVKGEVMVFLHDLDEGKIGKDEAAKKLDEFGAKLKKLADNGDEMAKDLCKPIQDMKEHLDEIMEEIAGKKDEFTAELMDEPAMEAAGPR